MGYNIQIEKVTTSRLGEIDFDNLGKRKRDIGSGDFDDLTAGTKNLKV